MYIKKIQNGIITNPITKENPFLGNVNTMFLMEKNRAENSKRKVWRTVQNKFFKGSNAVKV